MRWISATKLRHSGALPALTVTDSPAGRSYMPRTYWQVTASVLAIELEASHVKPCSASGRNGRGHQEYQGSKERPRR